VAALVMPSFGRWPGQGLNGSRMLGRLVALASSSSMLAAAANLAAVPRASPRRRAISRTGQPWARSAWTTA
jgi:hypothetical protein